jgi:riboflavin kinase / FMN adenylyltransferase
MQTLLDIYQAQIAGPTLLTIGNFDGLHRGHQALLQQLQHLADDAAHHQPLSARPQTGLVTFDPHPLAVLRPDHAIHLLTTPRERLALAAETGLDFGMIQPFTHELAQLEPQAFMRLLKRHLGLAALVVGPDFALGRNRSGNLDTLRQVGQELGYVVHVVEPVLWQGKSVRSSNIRQILQNGEVNEAADLLGRNYTVTGKVVEGDRRGRQIGVPTANVQPPPEKLLPANGVYATRTHIISAGSTQSFNSATNLGVRPTVDGLHHRVETHLLDFPPPGHEGDLYGQTVTIEFVARLRGEIRFTGLEALVAQIHADVAQARQILQQATLPESSVRAAERA